jgi:hypothetical protein
VENGILAMVPGEIIAHASNSLPKTASVKVGMEATADATLVDGTKVRLHYQLAQRKHRRSPYRWWCCVRAEEV